MAAFDDSTDNHAEPNFHLVQPRAVLWNINEANFSLSGRQKCLSRFLIFQDPRLSLHAQFFRRKLESFHQDDPQHQTLGPVRVELIHDDSPVRIRMPIHRAFAVIQKIRFGSRWAERGRNRFACDDIERRDQAQRAMTFVFELDAFFLPGPHLFFGAIRSSA